MIIIISIFITTIFYKFSADSEQVCCVLVLKSQDELSFCRTWLFFRCFFRAFICIFISGKCLVLKHGLFETIRNVHTLKHPETVHRYHYMGWNQRQAATEIEHISFDINSRKLLMLHSFLARSLSYDLLNTLCVRRPDLFFVSSSSSSSSLFWLLWFMSFVYCMWHSKVFIFIHSTKSLFLHASAHANFISFYCSSHYSWAHIFYLNNAANSYHTA